MEEEKKNVTENHAQGTNTNQPEATSIHNDAPPKRDPKNTNKKRILIGICIAIIAIIVILSALSNNSTNNSSNDNQSSVPNQKIEEEQKKNDVRVTVTNKKNVPKDTSNGRYSDRVEFSFKIENLTSRSIKGIQGTLTVYDLFDKKIISINCDFTGQTISPNSYITVDDLGIDINQFMSNHIELYNEKFNDLKFSYEVTNIVYTDSSTNNQNNTLESDEKTSNVLIEVTNKYNLGKDYDANRYSERVEFDFKVTNKSSKTIKGVQGTLIVKDLFGKKIISINCDFTGKDISPNKYVTFTGLGIDINQFMDNHVELYNEKYADLNFEYVVKSIVYTDGSVDSYE